MRLIRPPSALPNAGLKSLQFFEFLADDSSGEPRYPTVFDTQEGRASSLLSRYLSALKIQGGGWFGKY